MTAIRLNIGIACFALLCACAASPQRVVMPSGRLPPGLALQIDQATGPASLARRAEAAVRSQLVQNGHRLSGGAEFGVQVTIARRDDGTGFAAPGNGETASGKRRRQHLTLCDAGIFRMSIAVVDLRTAAIAYRGYAEDVSCHEPDEKGLATLAAAVLQSLR